MLVTVAAHLAPARMTWSWAPCHGRGLDRSFRGLPGPRAGNPESPWRVESRCLSDCMWMLRLPLVVVE